jgi:hypothetical protein
MWNLHWTTNTRDLLATKFSWESFVRLDHYLIHRHSSPAALDQQINTGKASSDLTVAGRKIHHQHPHHMSTTFGGGSHSTLPTPTLLSGCPKVSLRQSKTKYLERGKGTWTMGGRRNASTRFSAHARHFESGNTSIFDTLVKVLSIERHRKRHKCCPRSA